MLQYYKNRFITEINRLPRYETIIIIDDVSLHTFHKSDNHIFRSLLIKSDDNTAETIYDNHVKKSYFKIEQFQYVDNCKVIYQLRFTIADIYNINISGYNSSLTFTGIIDIMDKYRTFRVGKYTLKKADDFDYTGLIKIIDQDDEDRYLCIEFPIDYLSEKNTSI